MATITSAEAVSESQTTTAQAHYEVCVDHKNVSSVVILIDLDGPEKDIVDDVHGITISLEDDRLLLRLEMFSGEVDKTFTIAELIRFIAGDYS